MAYNYNANQFDQQFLPKSLCNWEVSKCHSRAYPRQKTKVTRIIANDRGHLLPGIGKSNKQSAFTSFRGTWDLPKKITTKQEAFELNGLALQTPFSGPRWIKRATEQQEQQQHKYKSSRKKSQSAKELRLLTKASATDQDLSYVPGEIVEPSSKTPNHLELEKLRLQEELINPAEQGNKLYLEEHNCGDQTESSNKQLISADNPKDTMMKYHVSDKPTEIEDFLPYIPAYYNFETARIMAQENLRHQPLHAVDDAAFRAMQATGDPFPGLALDVMPRTTGVGVRNYQAGPTQCTKMRVYRPKTCGIVPKPLEKSYMDRPHSSICEKKMGPMDLAICWDYRPFDPRDEPRPPTHIDGSNGSVAPAVFAIVKTPRQPDTAGPTGRSTGALFSNTMGEENFFDKDLLKRNRDYKEKYSLQSKCECGNGNDDHVQMMTKSVRHSAGSNGSSNRSSSSQRPKTTARNGGSGQQFMQQNLSRSIYKSSPNLSQINEEQDHCQLVCISHNHREDEGDTRQRYRSQPDLNYPVKNRIARECHKTNSPVQAKVRLGCPKQELRPFKAGLPRNSNSFDSGCSSMSDLNQPKQQVRVPKPRDPYAPKNYNINTLAPPFACWKGGSGQGGYPEHWRLASVYQHAYKPIDQRRRPLMQTVYQ